MRLDYYLPKKFQGYLSTGFVLFLFAVLLSSCLKNDDDDYVPKYTDLLIVNADPGSQQGVYFWYNGTTVETPIPYSQNSSYYNGLVEGASIAFFNAANTTTAITGGRVPMGDKSYSVYVAGKGDSSFVVEDVMITPATGNAAIRFVNASKSAGAVDVVFSTSTEKLTNVKFHGAEGQANPVFKGYTAGATEVNVYETGTTTNPLATYTFTPVQGSSYSLYLRGVKNGTGTKALGIGRVDHTEAAK